MSPSVSKLSQSGISSMCSPQPELPLCHEPAETAADLSSAAVFFILPFPIPETKIKQAVPFLFSAFSYNWTHTGGKLV
ncbi:MAG: hypothetical protein IJ083_05920 [Clostridia bacterium]|nr:hypothetical protein [Clostridia bacterium]